MRDKLITINQVIASIHTDAQYLDRVGRHCRQLQELCYQIQQSLQYPYLLFLAEVYSFKLGQLGKAESLCQKILNDPRPSVAFESMLKLCKLYINEKKYNKALNLFSQRQKLPSTESTKQILKQFCIQQLNTPNISSIKSGLNFQQQQKYFDAIREYQKIIHTDEDIGVRYFCAKKIVDVYQFFRGQRDRNDATVKVIVDRSAQVLENMYDQNPNQIQVLQKEYESQKQLMNQIAQIVFSNSNRTSRQSKHIKTDKSSYNYLQIKRILSILKLKKVISTSQGLSNTIQEQLEECLEELQVSQSPNINMLNDFVEAQFESMMKLNRSIERKMKNDGFSLLIAQKQGQNLDRSLSKGLSKKNSNTVTYSPFGNKMGSSRINQPFARQTYSDEGQDILEQFTGSYMYKINETSDGHEKRYFYFRKEELDKGKLKLYYCSKRQKVSKDDSYYDMKKLLGIQWGKQTKALQRKECSEFAESKCFSILLDGSKPRNFYVPEQRDFQKWMQVLNGAQSAFGRNNSSANLTNRSNVQKYDRREKSMSQSKIKRTVFN